MKKLALVGGDERTRSDAPFYDNEFDVWGFTIGPKQPWFMRCDAVIEVHRSALYLTHPDDPGYWEWLNSTDVDVWMFDMRDDIKNRKTYPLIEVDKWLMSNITIDGKTFHNFGSSADYGMALAILHGYQHIEVYGIEMQSKAEYLEQQTSWAFWVGYAAGRGITIDLKSGGHMFERTMYGRHLFGEDTLAFLKITEIEDES